MSLSPESGLRIRTGWGSNVTAMAFAPCCRARLTISPKTWLCAR